MDFLIETSNCSNSFIWHTVGSTKKHLKSCILFKLVRRLANSNYLKITHLKLGRRLPNLTKPEDFICSPFMFEFLGVPVGATIEERDLEKELLDHLQMFLLELGRGFCFEARQKRLLIGAEWYKVDLVFYHRLLKCHVLIDLKNEPFKGPGGWGRRRSDECWDVAGLL